MQATAPHPPLDPSVPWRVRRPGRPSPRRVLGFAALLLALGLLSTVVSTVAYLRLPAVTGDHAVGKSAVVWPTPSSSGRMRVVAWYPAVPGTGSDGRYLADLALIGPALEASGELGAMERLGLGLVADPARIDAQAAGEPGARFPLVILSPGNATNVEFYAVLAEELASQGFVVLGIDHPGQVTAVALGDAIVPYAGDPPLGDPAGVTPQRIDDRVVDIGAVLDQLTNGTPGLDGIASRIDLTRVGLLGHSNGGVAVATACVDTRVDACMNIDGQLAGGPFSARPDPVAPDKPFLYLTKETELHPALATLFEAGAPGTTRVVVPEGTHDAFADGPRFRPRPLPVDGAPERSLAVSRSVAAAFFDHTLRDAPRSVFGTLDAPTDIQVFLYPLEAAATDH